MLQVTPSDFTDFFSADQDADHNNDYDTDSLSQVESDTNPGITLTFTAEELARGRRIKRDRSRPICGFCGNDMPDDRIQPGKKGGQYKYCSPECQRRAADSAKSSRIKSVNKTLTDKINSTQTEDERDDALDQVFQEYVLFRIGFYRGDPRMNVKMRIQSEAVSNKFLFGNRSPKSVYDYMISYARKTYPTIKDSIFHPPTLEHFAKVMGWVDVDYIARYPAPAEVSQRTRRDTDAQPRQASTTPAPANPAPATAPKVETLADLDAQQIYSAVVAHGTRTKKSDGWAAWAFEDITGRKPEGLTSTAGHIYPCVAAAIRKAQSDYAARKQGEPKPSAEANDPREIILAMIPAKGGTTTPATIRVKMEREHGTSQEESARILNDLIAEGLVIHDPRSPDFLIQGQA